MWTSFGCFIGHAIVETDLSCIWPDIIHSTVNSQGYSNFRKVLVGNIPRKFKIFQIFPGKSCTRCSGKLVLKNILCILYFSGLDYNVSIAKMNKDRPSV